MIQKTAIVLGGLIEVLAILLANFLPLPGTVLWLGVVLALSTGLVGGLVAGNFSSGRWRTRALNGLLTGLIGGLLFGVTLWLGMSREIPRADQSAMWGINYAFASHPIGINQFPWLYTGNTLMVPIILATTVLFALERYIASGASPNNDTPQEPPISPP